MVQWVITTARKMKFSIKDSFSNCDQILGFGHININYKISRSSISPFSMSSIKVNLEKIFHKLFWDETNNAYCIKSGTARRLYILGYRHFFQTLNPPFRNINYVQKLSTELKLTNYKMSSAAFCIDGIYVIQ